MLIAPLDIETLLINTFSGSYLIFTGVALLCIAMLSTKFRFPIATFGSIILLYSVMMMPIAPWLFILSAMIAALLIGYTYTRIVKS
jgi:hypothetical protein